MSYFYSDTDQPNDSNNIISPINYNLNYKYRVADKSLGAPLVRNGISMEGVRERFSDIELVYNEKLFLLLLFVVIIIGISLNMSINRILDKLNQLKEKVKELEQIENIRRYSKNVGE